MEACGANRFDDDTMRSLVDASTYKAFHESIKTGTPPSAKVADAIAAALRDWAVERGANNFSHIFYPIRGMKPGLKIDAFIDLDYGDARTLKPIVAGEFDGSKLFMSETDGSSFPNGGLRATHTAAAYMLWDKTSPPYIRGDTVFLPSSFIAWSGDMLDYKTPLLRAQRAISITGTELLHNLGFKDVSQVVSNVGWEQEFFIVPLEKYQQRPDLLQAQRTVLGNPPPKNQQLSDCYFSTISERVKAFSIELQAALWKAGIAVSVFHNEVAPSQHELSPIFSLTNVASDQNILCVEIMNEIAAKHGLAVNFHEKPFAGINGTGKHSNWGLNSNTGMNLFVPGKTAEKQKSFIAFTAALMYGVKNYQEVLRTAVGSYGNDFRLGAQEAPPAIFSMYTGHGLGDHLAAAAAGGPLEGYTGGRYGGKVIDTKVNELGPLGAAKEDRNRTAPLPWCGNRWELRAVGGNANIAWPMAAMNTIIAEGCAYINGLVTAGKSIDDAVRQTIKENLEVVFNGNGYSSEWHVEAVEKRGLKNLPTTVDALDLMNSDSVKTLFSKHEVFSEAELLAMTDIQYERYAEDVNIEALVAMNMINTAILPAMAKDLATYKDCPALAGNRAEVYGAVATTVAELTAAVEANKTETPKDAAHYARGTVKPALDALRAAHDKAELLMEKSLYPYPTYEDMILPHHLEA